jgi:hypothetical protein
MALGRGADVRLAQSVSATARSLRKAGGHSRGISIPGLRSPLLERSQKAHRRSKWVSGPCAVVAAARGAGADAVPNWESRKIKRKGSGQFGSHQGENPRPVSPKTEETRAGHPREQDQRERPGQPAIALTYPAFVNFIIFSFACRWLAAAKLLAAGWRFRTLNEASALVRSDTVIDSRLRSPTWGDAVCVWATALG